ncbi:hypothetical protein LCGC14_0532440 [marine sediment metagenome]|uniref:Uncharacterized protein n=1 Tax=marine sediment metagenome TaxID=412755 RepID=A0A0F9RVC6_9ZZZZ
MSYEVLMNFFAYWIHMWELEWIGGAELLRILGLLG